MRLEECYRLLDLPPEASEDEVRRAYRDLAKVWHPDRFAHDPSLQAKAQEKLKQINAAYETILAGRSGSARHASPGAPPRADLRAWVALFTGLGFLILFRRPSLGGLLVAAVCFLIAIAFLGAMRTRR